MANSKKIRLTPEDLDVMSASKLNALLISNPAVQCSVCKHFLKPPIMFVSNDVGNVCGNCNTFEESNNAYHNTALETLLEDLVLPCSYIDNGCIIKLNYLDILAHKTICPLRDYECPLKIHENCKWKGSMLNLLKHILSHSTLSVQTTDNCFTLNLPDEGSTDFIKFLNLSSEDKFIFQARQVHFLDKMYFKIHYIGTRKEPETYCYKIFQNNCEGSTTEFLHGTFNIIENFDAKFFEEIDLNQMHFVNLKLCRLLAAKGKITFVIQITTKNNTNEKISKSILHALICPVCKFMMRPPILQCDGGHSICNKCKSKITTCPVCRTHSFSQNIRNYSLETFTEELYFPCVSRDFGCNVNLRLSEIENHESNCSYKLYKCDFCSWECQESSLIDHLKNLHGEKILFQSCSILLKSYVQSNEVFFISAFDRIFKIEVTKDSGYYFDWKVQLFGSASADVTFEYEIGGIAKEKLSKKFLHSNITSKTSNIYDKYYLNIQECSNT